MLLKKVAYDTLNPRQRENHNYQKISAVLADYGFVTIRLSDDWQSADFIAQHIDGETFLKVQLKGRLWLDKKYLGKSIFIAFPYAGAWYLYPHDEVAGHLLASSSIGETESWRVQGHYHRKFLSKEHCHFLEQYRL